MPFDLEELSNAPRSSAPCRQRSAQAPKRTMTVNTPDAQTTMNSAPPAADRTDGGLAWVLARVRLRSQRRVAWFAELRQAWAEAGTSAFEQQLQACLDDRDTPAAEAEWYEQAAVIQPLNAQLQRVEQALAGAAGAALQQLAHLFHLSQPELDILQVCAAIAIDPALGTVYAYLQQHPSRTHATTTLAGRLFGYGYQSLWQGSSPLALWGLVRAGTAAVGEPAPLAINPVVLAWLQGHLPLEAALVGRVQPVPPQSPLASWPLEATVQAIEPLLPHASVRVLIEGPAASGRRTFAATVAARFGLETVSVDTRSVERSEWPDLFRRVQRLAHLSNLAVVWPGSGGAYPWPSHLTPTPLQFVTHGADQIVPPSPNGVDYRVQLPDLSLPERRQLWQRAMPPAVTGSPAAWETLVSRYRLTVGDIHTIGQHQPISVHAAADLARELTRQRLGDLGHLLACPFTWDDLVLPPKVCQDLADFTFEAQTRSQFWESPQAQRLFPRGTGLVALFNGAPGTGKTMAAQVMAAELELDLFRIDLATVVSKYIGETAKHLGQIFRRAARMNAVLLFDEADALFSKRTEVKDSHDRYANADTNYLLQLLEEYRGIVILATNKKQNIDPAFIRRVRYVLDFPRPEKEQRQQIWQQVVGALGGAEVAQHLDTPLESLATQVEISGAQIKNAVLAAIFIAQRSQEPLGMPHLLRGVERELRKEGRSLGGREKERLMNYG